jgi:hypothetical protein
MPRRRKNPPSIGHVPTDDTKRMVMTMIANGIKRDVVAEVIGVSERKLASVYASEIRVASAKANSNVAQSLYQKAMGNGPAAVTAAIFWLKCRAHWKEVDPNAGGAGGGGGGGPGGINNGGIAVQIAKDDFRL